MDKRIQICLSLLLSAVLLSGCSTVSAPSLSSGNLQGAAWQGSNQQIWDRLQQTSSAGLNGLQAGTNDPTKTGWIQLALLSKRDSRNTRQLVNDLLAWRNSYPNHPANSLFPDNNTLTQLLSAPSPGMIAVLLPERGEFASSGQTVRAGLMSAYYNTVSSGVKQNIKFYDTAGGQSITDVYQQALADGATAVIGPLVKTDVQTLASNGAITQQTLALNYTQSTFSSLPNLFYEFGLLPEDDITQLVERARRDGTSHALVIAPDTAYGKRMQNAFVTQWKSNGGSIQDTLVYTPQTDFNASIAALLKINPDADKQLSQSGANRATLAGQRRQDFDVIFIFSNPEEGRVIVPLLRYYYADNVPVYATASIYSGRDIDLNGVTVCDTPMSLQSSRNPANGVPADRLNAVGQDAYTISQNLPRMVALPHFPLYGATGALYLTGDQQIHRRIPCTTVQNGLL